VERARPQAHVRLRARRARARREIAEGAPNAGNFDLELRPDGLWATNIHWTPRAEGYLRAGEYLYFSPAFAHDADGRVTRLVNIALTNLPATFGQEPLVAASERTKVMGEEALKKLTDSMANLAECLTKHGDALAKHGELLSKQGGGGGTGDDGKAEEPAKNADEPDKDDEEKKDEAAKNKALRDRVVALTGKASLGEAMGVLSGMKDAAAKLSQVQGELEGLKSKALEAEVMALVDGAIRDGKITPRRRASSSTRGRRISRSSRATSRPRRRSSAAAGP
jgi:phage I-like protein